MARIYYRRAKKAPQHRLPDCPAPVTSSWPGSNPAPASPDRLEFWAVNAKSQKVLTFGDHKTAIKFCPRGCRIVQFRETEEMQEASRSERRERLRMGDFTLDKEGEVSFR